MRVLVHETLPGVEERLFAQFKKDSSILCVCGVAGTKSAQAEERVSPARCSVISRETLATLNAAGTVGSRLVPTVFRGVETRPEVLRVRSRIAVYFETSNSGIERPKNHHVPCSRHSSIVDSFVIS